MRAIYLFWKRVEIPTLPQELELGGYYKPVDLSIPGAILEIRHPMDELDRQLLFPILKLVKVLHQIFSPEVRKSM